MMGMDDLDEKDDSKRKSRNASEKKRRDQFNILVTELGTIVSPNNRKMDKTTVLKSTIAFLKQHNESSIKSAVHEIQEDWKPSFLTNEEFVHLMLEALEGFVLVISTEGSIVYASESLPSLLGHLPREIINMSMYDLVPPDDKSTLFDVLSNPNLSVDTETTLYLHLRRGGAGVKLEDDNCEAQNRFELVKLNGYFRKWTLGTDISEQGAMSDDDSVSIKSGFSKYSSSQDNVEKTVFVCTVHLQTSQLLREIPLVQTSKNEFISRYSLEWKFLFLDHRAPQIIGYLPFELLGTSGYDYYHMDDLDRISQCHEALMQTGEATSCHHRFLSKGQQWIWLQTRYFITYHQWNSKPEFVVATHKVVNYKDVLRDLRRMDGGVGTDLKDTVSDAGSVDVKSSHYPTTDSPTWSSRSSVCGGGGGGGSSTGTGVSSRLSEHRASGRYVAGDQSDEYFSNEYDSISQFMTPAKDQASVEGTCDSQAEPATNASLQHSQPESRQSNAKNSPSELVEGGSNHTLYNQHPILISGPATPAQVRPQVVMTNAQVQLQEQLRVKHAELTKRIADQQEELRRISEQLLLSQYGLVPVPLTLAQSTSLTTSSLGQSTAMVGVDQPQPFTSRALIGGLPVVASSAIPESLPSTVSGNVSGSCAPPSSVKQRTLYTSVTSIDEPSQDRVGK